MILLDTNVLSELTKRRPSPRVVAWLEANEPLLAVPAITLAELRYGIARLPSGQRRSSLLRFWRMTCDRFRGRIFSFDERAAEIYGDVAARAERDGTRLNIADGQIAAIALVHGMQVATRDIGGFEASGAELINPRTRNLTIALEDATRDLVRAPEPDLEVVSPTVRYTIAKLEVTHNVPLHETPAPLLARWIERVVKVESPVHLDEVTRRIRTAFGAGQAGSRIRAQIRSAVRVGATEELYRLDEQRFLWRWDQWPTPGQRGGAAPRPRLTLFPPQVGHDRRGGNQRRPGPCCTSELRDRDGRRRP